MASHALQDHTGEVELLIDGATVNDVFVEAARALADLIGTPAGGLPGEWRAVTIHARDREALLVAWLDELIARTEIDRLRYADVSIDELTPQRLRARVRGTPIGESRTAVKAATLHRIRVDSGPDGASATVVLDV
ncbi:MAG: hypothetical protein H6Q90_19 [Deltaproteobacteria bacterium]|nr:hypothetical protein [Deltaproteobacteria bacterium]